MSVHTDRGYEAVFDHRPFEYLGLDANVTAFDGQIVLYSSLDGEVELSTAALHSNLTIHAMTMSNFATHAKLPSVSTVPGV